MVTTDSKGKQPQLDHPDHPIDPINVRTRDKVLAACLGGCLTSLTTTPLDVVKTRLQTQGQPSILGPDQHHHNLNQLKIGALNNFDRQAKCCGKTHWNSKNGHSQRNLFSKIQSQAINPSTCSSTSSSSIPSISLPLNTSSTIRNLLHEPHSSQSHLRLTSSSSGILATLLQIVKHEGLTSLWRGVAPSLMITIPAQAIYMLGYDTLRSTIRDLPPSSFSSSYLESKSSISFYQTTLTPLLSGAISRSFIAILFSPLELIRTRLQSTPTIIRSLHLQTFDSNTTMAPQAVRPSQILRTILLSVRSTGIRSLYSGLPATLWRDVPFSAIYWSSYEFTKKLLSGGKGFGETDSQSSVGQLASHSFIAGSLSGALAATLTNGFDVIKTRRQAQMIDNPKRLGTMGLLRQIARHEGLRGGLMKGLWPRIVKIMPSCGIMIASYEGLAHVLSRY